MLSKRLQTSLSNELDRLQAKRQKVAAEMSGVDAQIAQIGTVLGKTEGQQQG